MGTNYYWRGPKTQIRSRLDRARWTEIHVGKSSGGWSFMFRGWKAGDEPDEDSPFVMPRDIRSRLDWHKFFREHHGTIWDEYERKVEMHPAVWVMERRAPDPAQLERELAMEQAFRRSSSMMRMVMTMDRDSWRDPEGFRFGGYWFR